MSETLKCDHCGEVDLKGTPDVRNWLRLEPVSHQFLEAECLAGWAALHWTGWEPHDTEGTA